MRPKDIFLPIAALGTIAAASADCAPPSREDVRRAVAPPEPKAASMPPVRGSDPCPKVIFASSPINPGVEEAERKVERMATFTVPRETDLAEVAVTFHIYLGDIIRQNPGINFLVPPGTKLVLKGPLFADSDGSDGSIGWFPPSDINIQEIVWESYGPSWGGKQSLYRVPAQGAKAFPANPALQPDTGEVGEWREVKPLGQAELGPITIGDWTWTPGWSQPMVISSSFGEFVNNPEHYRVIQRTNEPLDTVLSSYDKKGNEVRKTIPGVKIVVSRGAN